MLLKRKILVKNDNRHNDWHNRNHDNDDVDHRRPKEIRKKRHDPKQLIRAGRYEELYEQDE